MDDVSYLDADAVFATLSPAEAVAALRETLAGGFDPSDDIPRTVTDVSAGNMIFMPSEFGPWVGVKLVGVSTDNAERGLPRILGQYLMYEADTLRLRTVIDGAALTTLRTPAVSVAAVLPALTRFRDPAKVVIFGAGPQGIGHADTIRAELDVAEAVFVVRSPDRVDDGVRDRGRVVAAGSEEANEALRAADIVVTATTAHTPLFDADLVRPGAVVMACGSHDPNSRELPAELFTRSEVVVEDLDTALREAGDIVLAITDGALDEDRTLIFKGSGMSWEDLAVAAKLVEAAGHGQE